MNDMLPDAPGAPAFVVDDCWNRIGVAGDGSCPLLAQYVRCLNCPTYARASRQLLDRMPVTAQGVDPLARDGAEHGWLLSDDAPGTATRQAVRDSAERWTQVIVFRVHGEWLALPVCALDEVAPIRAIHGIPHRRSGSLQGLVNVRGTLLPCVSLAAMLNIDEDSTHGPARARMLVLRTRTGSIVVCAHEVDGVRPLNLARLADVPSTLALSNVKHTLGWGSCGGRQVGLLDTARVVDALERGMQ